MVAYSFHKMFVPQVVDLSKLHTVRANRKRHARPGEAVQLYTAMRTKFCRKLVTPDPICTRLDDIRLEIGEGAPLSCVGMGVIEGIEINGRALSEGEIETFAIADGFSPARIPTHSGHPWPEQITARTLMGCFWGAAHGFGAWRGVIIHWKPEMSDG